MSKSTRPKSIEQYEKVIELYSSGTKIHEIVKMTGLGRSCINNWIIRGRKNTKTTINATNPIEYLKELNSNNDELKTFSYYSFLFGLYLGDGCLSISRVATLSIALDKKYEKMNNYIEKCFTELFNKNPQIYDRSIDRGQKFKSNSICIKCSKKNLEILFPQHGKGKKHSRAIELREWQNIIISHELVKGLIYSDGSYYYCKKRQQYEYNFSNSSYDIIKILEKHLTILNIQYNVNKKIKSNSKSKSEKYHINIVAQDSVKMLHNLIGDKNNPI